MYPPFFTAHVCKAYRGVSRIRASASAPLGKVDGDSNKN